MRAIHKIAVLGAALLAFGGIGVGTALADPYPPLSSPPALTSIEGVGSDTITPLFSGNETYNPTTCATEGGQTSGDLSQDYDATKPANLLYSWDAVNPCTGGTGDLITTKASSSTDTTCKFARPDGSSAGITALNNNVTDSGDPCIDYARSSRAPNTTSFKDAFAKVASDAIAWSYPVISGQTNPQPTSLTHAQLVDIYNCTDTTWNEVNTSLPATPVIPIIAVIPQAGSGTRATWQTDLGLSAFGSCVVNGTAPNGAVVEENTGLSSGNVDEFSTMANAQDVIFPYSIGDWIAQTTPAVKGTGAAGTVGAATVGGHNTDIWGHGNMKLGETVTPLGVAEAAVTTNSFSQPVINPAWSSQFDRVLYVVVRNGTASPTGPTTVSWPTTPSYESALQTIFGPSGYICKNVTAQSDIVSYGFGLESAANCGSLTAGD
jgi:ABC-type phosphate transport system substrate-binding protein